MELPASLHCRPTWEKPEKNCRAGCRERKRISIEATSFLGCPKNFFFFCSLNLPSRLLCDFYTCWPKIALQREQHCLSAARGLRGKREKGRSQIEFAALPAGWFFFSAQQNLLPSICSAASFYVLKKIAERIGGLLAYAELLREHFFWSTCEQYKRKVTDRQLLSLHSTAARKYDSRFKTQAKFQAKSSLHHVKFLRQRAAAVCYRAKNPGEAAHPPPPRPPAPKRRRGKGKAKRDDGVAPQHFKLTDAERDLFVDYLRE